MQALPNQIGHAWIDQWISYRIQAFGPLLDESERRLMAMIASRDPDASAIARKLSACCRNPMLVTVDDGARYFITENRCKSRVCPRCSQIRAKQLSHRISALIHRMDAPRFLTLTVRSTDAPLADQVKYLRRRFAAMRRTPQWTKHVTCGVYTLEITHNALTNQWHPHLHAIIDGSYWPHRDLLTLWEGVVHDQAGVDIRAVHGVRKLANYLAAYVAKSCDLSKLPSGKLAEWAVATHGLRLAQTFGRLQICKPQTEPAEPPILSNIMIDLNRLAYDASWGNQTASAILKTLMPGGTPRDRIDWDALGRAIITYDRPLSRSRPPPREHDRNQIPLAF